MLLIVGELTTNVTQVLPNDNLFAPPGLITTEFATTVLSSRSEAWLPAE